MVCIALVENTVKENERWLREHGMDGLKNK
jgi:hypothetical protein